MKRIKSIKLWFLASCLLTILPGAAFAAEPEMQKAVLVTGASSGIGRSIAERLAAEGYFVYAGARKREDINALSSIDNMQGVRLDVTVQADIDAAKELVQTGGRGLYAVVNNAGVTALGLLPETDLAEFEFVFDVNVYGPYRIIKSFAPLLIEARGRVVNISSMAGIMSPPGYGVYSMSKHALEAFSDTLAYEMGSVGVGVSAIEPGPFNSNAGASSCERLDRQAYDPTESLFPQLAAELATACNDVTLYPEPDPVADAVLQVLHSETPKARYLAPSHPRQAEFLIRNLLRDLSDLRSGPGYHYDREELITMLDEALADSHLPSTAKR